LEESQKLDAENYMYPYEIAYAHIQKKEYEKAIKILNKVKKYHCRPKVLRKLKNNLVSPLFTMSFCIV
jgi:hypothetical protein